MGRRSASPPLPLAHDATRSAPARRSDASPTGASPSPATLGAQNAQSKKRKVSAKTQRATIKFTPEQHQMIRDRARSKGVKATVWMRSVLLQAAVSTSTAEGGRGYIRIKEPSGETL